METPMNQCEQLGDALPERISCLALNLARDKLLVPVTAVAEVINTRVRVEDTVADGALYGWIHWRDQRIPLLSLDVLLGGARPPLGTENRLLVLNAIGALAETGFYAVHLQSLPTPVQVEEASVRSSGAERLLLAFCDISDERYRVPDFAALEAAIAKLLSEHALQ